MAGQNNEVKKKAKPAKEIIGPASPFQEKYLKSNAKIIVAGGSAGSSKSYIGLMRHLRWADDPNYRGFCIRKNSTAIMKSGGLFQEAVKLYSKVYPNLKVKLKEQKICFPSGAEVAFSHYENDSAGNLYQGLAMSNIFYDESSHADESHIWWLISRLRTDAKLEPSIWLSCNPDPASFLFDWVKWWLYPEGHEKYGLPDPEKNGIVRWIVRLGGEISWADSREEAIEKYGRKDIPHDHPDQIQPLSFQVLLGTIYDNPPLMKAQPQYKSMLEALPDVERRRLLLGDWTAVEGNSTYFLRTWCQEATVEPPASEIVKTVRSYDLAGTLKSDSNYSPDYSACTKMSRLKDGTYFIHDIKRCRIRFGQWKSWILENALEDGNKTDIILPIDPNPAAKAATQMLARELSAEGLYVRTLRTSTSKLDRFRPFSSMAMNGGVTFLKGCGYDLENKIESDLRFVYRELENFDGTRKSGEAGHDDIVDTISDCFSILAQKSFIPNFTHALQAVDLTQRNVFD